MLFYLVGGLLGVGVAGQCATGLPLVNTLGARLFCGVGAGSVACPAGSACLLPAGVCCRNAPIATTTTTATVVVTTPVVPVIPAPPLVVAKCQFGSPWKNALGVEYDCGPGPKHADCPVGSQCITGPNGVFHACCATSATSVPPPLRPATIPIPTVVTTTIPAIPAIPAIPPIPAIPLSPPAATILPLPLAATCKFGTPLKNAAGLEFFCGEGPNHQDCPAQSECLIGPNNAFAACCAISASAFATFTSSQVMISNPQVASTTMMQQGSIIQGSRMQQEEESDSTMTVRFLNIRVFDKTNAIMMWAHPEGEEKPSSYLAEFSYDGQNWNELTLEEPDATFAEFTVNADQSFEVRVTPEGGSPSMETFQFKPEGKGKSGKMGKTGKMGN